MGICNSRKQNKKDSREKAREQKRTIYQLQNAKKQWMPMQKTQEVREEVEKKTKKEQDSFQPVRENEILPSFSDKKGSMKESDYVFQKRMQDIAEEEEDENKQKIVNSVVLIQRALKFVAIAAGESGGMEFQYIDAFFVSLQLYAKLEPSCLSFLSQNVRERNFSLKASALRDNFCVNVPRKTPSGRDVQQSELSKAFVLAFQQLEGATTWAREKLEETIKSDQDTKKQKEQIEKEQKTKELSQSTLKFNNRQQEIAKEIEEENDKKIEDSVTSIQSFLRSKVVQNETEKFFDHVKFLNPLRSECEDFLREKIKKGSPVIYRKELINNSCVPNSVNGFQTFANVMESAAEGIKSEQELKRPQNFGSFNAEQALGRR